MFICLRNLYFTNSSFKYIIITALLVKESVVGIAPRDLLFIRMKNDAITASK